MKSWLYLLILVTSLAAEWTPVYDERAYKSGIGTAVAIVAFNRPQYLSQLLETIEKNQESKTLPFYFFLDGGPYSKQAELVKLIESSNIPNKQILLRETNYGCPKNHIDAKRFLFDWCGYDRVVVMEEDLKIASNYFRTLLHLDDWAHERYPNVGTVQLWAECQLLAQEKQVYLPMVYETRHWWSLVTYAIRREVWDQISSLLYKFEKDYIDPLLEKEEFARARSKPSQGPYREQIDAWIDGILSCYDRKKAVQSWGANPYLLQSRIPMLRIIESGGFNPNQDCMTTLSIWLAGYVRLQSVVNRTIHIGEYGITYTKGKRPYDPVLTLDEFEEDDTLLEFVNLEEGVLIRK